MDSSPVLRQQNQNKISNFPRTKNEQNQINHPKSPKSATHNSNQDENKDPQKSAAGKKTPVQPGVSRLPVLAKSLHLPTSSNFSLSNCKWEEKPLAGKAKKEKPSTRPLPFSRTHSRISRKAAENEQPISVLQSKTGVHSVQPNDAAHSITQKLSNARANPSKNLHVSQSTVDLTKSTGRANEKITENTAQPKGQHGTISTFNPHLSHHLATVRKNTLHQSSPASSAEACIHNMNQLSIKDLAKTPQSVQLTEQAKGSTGENFQADHAALLSILRNEGVSSTGLGSKTYNNLPQRVSVLKKKQKPGPTAGFTKSEPFSPDPAALQSILQNEGVKVGGFLGSTPKNSICPSGRGTSSYTAQRVPVRKQKSEPFSPDPAALQSILQNEGVKVGGFPVSTPKNSICPSGRGTSSYTAQRVPVRKQKVEATRGPAAGVKDPVDMKCTPQRVLNTRPQPMSAMKWHTSKQPSLYCTTPGLRRCETKLRPHQEEIVQRLFDDQEEDSSPNGTENDPEKPVQDTLTKPPERKEETCSANESEQQRTLGAQPFIQAPQRDSVIFFSTGKKLLRVPRFERQDISTVHEQDCCGPTEPRQALPAQEVTREESKPPCRPAALHSLHKDFIVQKSCGVSSAVAMLRKRLPPFEELRLDEEVATYTSMSVSAATGFLTPRPRCGNPLATMLHFEESSAFIPIGLDPSPHSMWPCSLTEGR